MLFYSAPPASWRSSSPSAMNSRCSAAVRPAARLLARRDCVSHRRAVRRLCAGADLRGHDLLVRVRARPRHRRSGACGDGGAADGRHFAVHGAVAGFRSADPGHGAVGGGAVALLAGGDARPTAQSWYVLGVAAAALLLLTSDAALILLGALAVFTAVTERGRAALERDRTVDRRGRAGAGSVPASALAARHGRPSDAGARSGCAKRRPRASNTAAWLRLLIVLLLAHAGLPF